MDEKQTLALKDLTDMVNDPKLSDLARRNVMLQIIAIIVLNITDLTYHVRIWESTFLQRKDSPSGQESYLSQFL